MGLEAVLLDRDGIICVNRVDHVKDWDEFELLPGVDSELLRLTEMGLRLAIVTNQAIIGRGMVSRTCVNEINSLMCEQLHRLGVEIDGVFICPHTPEDRCVCRKPEPGLILDATDQMNIKPNRSCIVGDVYSDMAAGFSGGCRSGYLVPSSRDQGSSSICVPKPWQRFSKVQSLHEAVSEILAESDNSDDPI